MKIITNLKQLDNITIGEHFVFGNLGEPIEWRKISDDLAITEKIIDCIYINLEKNRISEIISLYIQILTSHLGLTKETLSFLNINTLLQFFPTNESLQARGTEWAKLHGLYVRENGFSSWLTTTFPNVHPSVYCINSKGNFYIDSMEYIRIGVRLAIKI